MFLYFSVGKVLSSEMMIWPASALHYSGTTQKIPNGDTKPIVNLPVV